MKNNTRRTGTKTYTVIVIAILLAFAAFLWHGSYSQPVKKKTALKAHLTVYIAEPLLSRGGTVLVVANPIPMDKWRALPTGFNPAANDASNDKKSTLKSGDKLFGVVTSNNASIIEFVYPEGGTFGFNFVASKADNAANSPLRTKQILIGDGGYTDWTTGQDVPWDYVSTIHVFGPEATEEDSRGIRVFSSRIMNLHPEKTTFEGASLYSPTDTQIDEAVIKSNELK